MNFYSFDELPTDQPVTSYANHTIRFAIEYSWAGGNYPSTVNASFAALDETPIPEPATIVSLLFAGFGLVIKKKWF